MKKLFLVLAAVALLCTVSPAQVPLPDIYGTVVLPDGSPIPGVTVTLTGDVVGKMTAVTSEEGNFRFLKLSPGNFELMFELEGFKTVIRKGLRLYLGKNVTLTIQMETSPIKEEVVVTAKAGVVDTRKTTVGVNLTKEEINLLPQARNPWSVFNLIPGMQVDREDVGGNESGQQSNFYQGGTDKTDVAWNIDGSNITDVSAFGAPSYLDVNAYDEIQVQVGSNDIMNQVGGAVINFVSKRGGNKVTGDFHLYAEDGRWEMTPKIKEGLPAGYISPGINRTYQYGFNIGGPIVKDKVFWTGSWSMQDIRSRTITNTEDATMLNSAYGKINAQFGNTQLEFNLSHNNKTKENRPDWGPEYQEQTALWAQRGPGYSYLGTIQQMFGNLMVSVRYNWTTNPFNLHPYGNTLSASGDNMFETGDDMVVTFDNPTGFFVSGGYQWQDINRRTQNLILDANYFAENVLGGDHEIRFGGEYFSNHTWTDVYFPNQRILLQTSDFNAMYPVSGYTYPDTIMAMTNGPVDTTTFRAAGWLADTVNWNKLTLNIGVRYDYEWGVLNEKTAPGFTINGATVPAWEPYIGPKTSPKTDSPAKWKTFSPRISFTYDLTGDGKNVVKLSLARYSRPAGTQLATFLWTLGFRWIRAPWADANGDGVPQVDEITAMTPPEIIAWQEANPGYGDTWPNDIYDPLYSFYGTTYPVFCFGGFDYTDPMKVTSSSRFDPNYKSSLMDEIVLQYERELGEDMAISLQGIYKKNTKLRRLLAIRSDNSLNSADNYYVSFTDPVTGQDNWSAASRDFIGTYITNYDKRYYDYKAVQVIFTKKLSAKWMANASFTYGDWLAHYDFDEEFDARTNFDFFDGGVRAPAAAGSGMTGVLTNSRYMFKLNGLYQLPWDINVSGVFTLREGYPVRIADNSYRGVLFYSKDKKLGVDRLPDLWTLNLSVQKEFKISDTTRAVFHVDGYNITNNNTTLNLVTRFGSSSLRAPTRILNPGVFMFGINVYF